VDQYPTDLLTIPLRRKLPLLLAVLLAGFGLTAAQSPPADLIVWHAKVYTVEPRLPWAQAVAVRGERIVAVGSDEQIARWRGPQTRVVDAQGHLVLPGFTDSHIHFLEGSLALTHVNLDETSNVAEIQKVLREYGAAHPATDAASAWILGRGWSYPEFGAAAMPDKKYLDELFPDRPVSLTGFDGHTSWANSVALKLAGITRETPDPLNGKIVRDAAGEATGALQEAAADLVANIVPTPTRAEQLAALSSGIAEANRLGLTRVISCGNDTAGASDHNHLDLMAELRRQGKLTLRFYVSTYADPGAAPAQTIREAERLRKQYPASDQWLAVGAVKFFLDGVIEGHTAAMLEPYADDPSQRGPLRWDPKKYKRLVADLDRRGFQIFTHAIGDRAVRLALDAYQQAEQRNHSKDPRDRIEHIETVSAADIPRFGSLRVVASFQPLHAYPDDDTLKVWLKGVGPEREPRAWAWHSIAEKNGVLAFGSDWPVVTMNPWYGIQTALTRQTRDGKPEGGFVPQQRISLAQAIAGYTMGAAIGGRREKTEGSLAAGKVADLIVLSEDLFTIEPSQISKTEVLVTVVGGRIVYTAPAGEKKP
jgi:predicted amidohydrolase YtcJ